MGGESRIIILRHGETDKNEKLKKDYNKIYLSARSSTHSYYFNQCKFDKEKYLESNKKLLKYYESQHFVISKDLYDVLKCSESDNIIVYNVLSRNIK